MIRDREDDTLSRRSVKLPVSSNNVEGIVDGMDNLNIKGKEKRKRYKNNKKKGKKAINHNSGKDVLFDKFSHSSMMYLPRVPKKLFQTFKEVALYSNDRLYTDINSIDKTDIVSELKPEISSLSDNHSIGSNDVKEHFIGADLFQNHERYTPMGAEELDSIEGCIKYLNNQAIDNESFIDDQKLVIVSARHHIVSLGMNIFNEDNASEDTLICTYLKSGLILFTEDVTNKSYRTGGIYSENEHLRKICFSGFALEDLLIKEDEKKLAFSIVKGSLSDNISLLLRCEMDAYDSKHDIYSELKCYSKLKLSNTQHRRKLLKTWLQTELCADSNIIIGIRNPFNGILDDIQSFSRDALYHKFNNRNLIASKKYFNFNANIAIEWTQFCINSICKLIKNNIDDRINDPQSFKIRINGRHNISIEKLQSTPNNVDISSIT